MAVTLLYVPLMSYIDGRWGRGSFYYGTQFLYFLSFLLAVPSALRSINNKVVCFVLCFSFVLLLSYIVGTDSEVFSLSFRNICLWCAPYFILSISVRNYEDMMMKFKYVSVLMLLLGLLRTFTLDFSSDTYSQDLGYDVLLPFIVYFLSFMREHRIWYLIPILVSFVLILMSGSRGPLLCAGAGAVLAYFILRGISKNVILYLFLVLLAYIFYVTYRVEILSWVLNAFESLDVSVRSIKMLLYGEIGDDQSRTHLRMIALNYIFDHPFIGSGLLNDRSYIYGQYIINKTATAYGSYCHNIFLEILMQFGLIAGIVIISIFMERIVNRIRCSASKVEKEYIVVILTIGLFPLFISRSWITYHFFYLVLGMLLSSYNGKTSWLQSN